MPAPKGNKFAAKDNPKTGTYLLKIRPENLMALKKIAAEEKTSVAQVIEKSLLSSYPSIFDGKF